MRLVQEYGDEHLQFSSTGYQEEVKWMRRRLEMNLPSFLVSQKGRQIIKTKLKCWIDLWMFNELFINVWDVQCVHYVRFIKIYEAQKYRMFYVKSLKFNIFATDKDKTVLKNSSEPLYSTLLRGQIKNIPFHLKC